VRCVLYVCLRIGTVEGSCEYYNEQLASIRGVEFIDQLNNCQFFKTDPYSVE